MFTNCTINLRWTPKKIILLKITNLMSFRNKKTMIFRIIRISFVPQYVKTKSFRMTVCSTLTPDQYFMSTRAKHSKRENENTRAQIVCECESKIPILKLVHFSFEILKQMKSNILSQLLPVQQNINQKRYKKRDLHQQQKWKI